MPRSFFHGLLGALVSTTLAVHAQAQENQTPQVDQSQAQIYDFENTYAPPRLQATASLLYLQPGSGNLEYGTLVTPLPVPTPNWANQSINPNFSPAFLVGLRYIYTPCIDFQVNWTHLSTYDTASFSGTPAQMVGPPYQIGPDANAYKIANGSVHFGYDAVNMDAGHYWGSGGPFSLRVFGGLQFARIRQNLTGSFSSTDGLTTTSNTNSSLFTGVGPRMGMKAQCTKGNFTLLGEMAGAILLGTMQSHMYFSATSPTITSLGIPSPNTQSLTSPTSTQVMPAIDSHLGASYTLPTANWGTFKFEAGYQAVAYLNAINQYSITDVVLTPAAQSVGVFLVTQQRTQSNFTAHGPYLSGSWAF